ncbi:hypothetical protein EXIGLDRAFT_111959 [Exidia glandulosa HHB12029]|uniref:Uncharacterized protein n=1 Tax=Exidia glandulosa HHB12029 TaxID=1314781 RepID=A0A165NLM2_EXIGL|nr:hypothetical protein EXIGLDRAFT_111959 [Exidia glandulosa HHB12029]
MSCRMARSRARRASSSRFRSRRACVASSCARSATCWSRSARARRVWRLAKSSRSRWSRARRDSRRLCDMVQEQKRAVGKVQVRPNRSCTRAAMRGLARLRLVRSYATRRPELPPPRFPDPLENVKGVEVAPNLTFFHRPPPSMPTPESLTTAPASPLLRRPARTPRQPPQLPPPVSGKLPEQKKYHLTAEQINEIRRLRAEDPVKYSRSALAKRFDTTSWFVATVSKVPKERKKVLDAAVVKQREGWGELKRLAVDVRKKRREFW